MELLVLEQVLKVGKDLEESVRECRGSTQVLLKEAVARWQRGMHRAKGTEGWKDQSEPEHRGFGVGPRGIWACAEGKAFNSLTPGT